MEINKIYNVDCIEFMKSLPENSIDMIFTDPPYKLKNGGKSKLNGLTAESGVCHPKHGCKFYIPKFEDWIKPLFRVLKNNSYAFIMVNDLNMFDLLSKAKETGFKFCELLVMKKQNKVVNLYFHKQAEFILMFRKGKYRKLNKHTISTVIDVTLKKGKNKIHPTEKPISLYENFILSCSNENDLVFDLFSGSGNLAVACKNLKRNFICCEIDKEYYDRSILRLKGVL
jgi:site-specific DNA-methyltransferase (adenine-specific)